MVVPFFNLLYYLEEQGEWTEPYFFIFAADPQPGLEDMIKGGDGKKGFCFAWLQLIL